MARYVDGFVLPVPKKNVAAHRDRVNAKVMRDPRLAGMGAQAMPLDARRMIYGGFEIAVDF